MIYKYIFYLLLLNYIFIDSLPLEINYFLFLIRYYSFFLINLLFCLNILIVNNIEKYQTDINYNLLKNYIISNGIYFIDFITIISQNYVNLGDYLHYYTIPIVIFNIIIIHNIINLKDNNNLTIKSDIIIDSELSIESDYDDKY